MWASDRLVDSDLPPTATQPHITPLRRTLTRHPLLWQRTKTRVLNLIPVLQWLPKYEVKNLTWDFISGLMVATLQIPHGLAFAQLAGQNAAVGIHTAIFPIFIYFLLGTSQHISLGINTVLLSMIGEIVQTHTQTNITTNEYGLEDVGEHYNALQIGVACTFTIGLWQIALACLQLGSLCVLLSNSLISGLTSAVALHIIFLQLRNVLGVQFLMPTGPLKLFYLMFETFKNVPSSNIVSVLTGLSVIIIMVTFNQVLKPMLVKKCQFPYPVGFILICLGGCIVYMLDLNILYNVDVLGAVPNELPAPTVPPLHLIPKIALPCLVIALADLSINLSMARVFAKKSGYKIRQSQEILAYGAANLFGGFFQCVIIGGDLLRSMVLFTLGAKTLLSHLICATLVLIFLRFFGPFFEYIPYCVLASLVIVTIFPLFLQVSEFPDIWKKSKSDGIVWIVTFLSVVSIDIEYGIAIGLIANIIVLTIQTLSAKIIILERVNQKLGTQFSINEDNSSEYLIICLNGSINFVNRRKLFKRAQIEIDKFITLANGQSIVLDFSNTHDIDDSTVSKLILLCNYVKSKNCNLFIGECHDEIKDKLNMNNLFVHFNRNDISCQK